MDTSAGAWELKRSIEHRPSPCARGRITEILAGGAQAEVRTRRAREPTEGASGDGDRGLVARGQPYHRTPANIRARADAQSSEDVGRDRDHGQGKRAQSSLPTPSKSAGGRTHYRNIWVWGGGRGASDFRARRATEPTEGAMVGPSPRTCRTGPAPTTNTIRCPRAPGHVIERKCGEGPIPRTGKESPIEPSYGVQVRGSAAALPQYLRGNASRSPRTKGHGTDRRGEGGLRPPTGSTGPNPPKNTRNIWFGWVGGGGGGTIRSPHTEGRGTDRRGERGDGANGQVARDRHCQRTPSRADAKSSKSVIRDRDHCPGERDQSRRPAPSKSARARPRYRNICWGGGTIRCPRTKGLGSNRRGEGAHMGGSHGTNPANEHHPTSARARPRYRNICWGAQSDVRARRATEQTEGAGGGRSPRTGRRGPSLPTNTVPCPRARGRV